MVRKLHVIKKISVIFAHQVDQNWKEWWRIFCITDECIDCSGGFKSIVDIQSSFNFCYTAKWPSHTYIHSFFSITIFHHVITQETGQSSLCCTVGPDYLFILNVIVCIHQPKTSLSSPGKHKSVLHIHDLFLFFRWDHVCHILDSTYKWYHMVFVFLILSYLVRESLVPSMLLKMALFCPFSWTSSIPLYICAISSQSIHLSMNIWVVSMSWLLWIVLQWM